MTAGAGRRRFARALAMLLLAASLGACGSGFDMFGNKDDDAARRGRRPALQRGPLSAQRRQEPKEAAKKFEEVDRQHPYSEWARKALIMSSYAYYTAGDYDDCVTAAQRYITLHPGSPDAAYAQYLIGASQFRRNPRHHPRSDAHREGARRA